MGAIHPILCLLEPNLSLYFNSLLDHRKGYSNAFKFPGFPDQECRRSPDLNS